LQPARGRRRLAGPEAVADGIDTSSKHPKLSFTVKSLVADIYLDALRDRTLRAREGRALAGFATGNVAYGYHTVPVEEGGRVIGNKDRDPSSEIDHHSPHLR
jgi:DNA invertase Pin-like site-specific DNA recombinase